MSENVNVHEIESRLSDLEERVYSSQDSGNKIGKLQTRLRKLGDRLEGLENSFEDHDAVIDRVRNEEKVLDDIQSDIKVFRKELDESVERIDERTEENLEELNQKIDELNESIELASDFSEAIEWMADEFDEFRDELLDEIGVQAHKVEMNRRMVSTMITDAYFNPSGGRPQKIVSDRIYRIEEMDRNTSARFFTFLSRFVSTVENMNLRKILSKVNANPELLAGFMATELVNKFSEDRDLNFKRIERDQSDDFLNVLTEVFGESDRTIDRLMKDSEDQKEFWRFCYDVVCEDPERIDVICDKFEDEFPLENDPDMSDSVDRVPNKIDDVLCGDLDE